jgi:hypothetical protein
MDSEIFVACVGKYEDSPEVQALLASMGQKKKLKMPSDDIDVRIDLLTQGVTLIFEPESRKSSQLLMTGVQFFSDAEKDYKTFQGPLPGGVVFAETQAEVIAKLGKPSFSRKGRYDAWRINGQVLSVAYSKTYKTVSMVSFEMPEKE